MAQFQATCPFCHGNLIDIWIFADLSLEDFAGPSKQKELNKQKKNFEGLSSVKGPCS